jgi:uncharacterized Zn finger protein
MSRDDEGWAPYVPVAERRRRAKRAMEKLRKTGHPVAPVTISGRLIATTFWGRAWCDNMESYRDYETRLPRGRTYVRNGSVVDLQIAPGRITALVSGSELYRVAITIKETAKTHWRAICADCAGSIDSLVELLQGRFSKGVMERLCRQQSGMFPRPSDIRFSCSCLDHASMCKHVAAVLYGVGARLDHKPELLFRLRAVDESDLLARIDTSLPLSTKGPTAEKVLGAEDVSALFGLDMAETPETGRPSDRRSPVCDRAPKPVRAAAPKKTAPQPAVAVQPASTARRTLVRSSAPDRGETELRKAAVEPVIVKQADVATHSTAARSRASMKAATATASPKPDIRQRGAAGKQGLGAGGRHEG